MKQYKVTFKSGHGGRIQTANMYSAAELELDVVDAIVFINKNYKLAVVTKFERIK